MVNVRKLFVALVFCALGLSAAVPATGQGIKWWQSERFQKELTLSPEQITRLDEIFQSSLPALRAQKRALDKLEDELSEMILDARVLEPELEAFVARVEAARAELAKTRTLQLYRMRRVLTVDQHTRMKSLHDEWERERRRNRDDRPHPEKKNDPPPPNGPSLIQ
ncbi:MAG: periplasmic heavy metal sensor [Acidobacteria bacterium]|nr:periplasmic heavy metal sensor [Acidobacteriota bacterium]